MTQDDAQHVRPSLAPVFLNDGSAGTKVDLGFLARGHFHPSVRQWRSLFECRNEPPNTVVLPFEGMLGNQILENPLSRQSLVQLGNDQLTEGFAQTARPGGRFGLV